MPDLAESSLEFYDRPVYDEYLASVGEAQLELVGGVVIVEYVSVPAPYVPPVTTVPTSIAFAADSFEDFGVDISTYPELSDTFALITSRRSVAEVAYRRLSTDAGSLAFHSDAGLDLRLWLNEGVTDTRLFALREEVERELERDERVERCVAKVTFDAQTGALGVVVDLYTAEGPFTLTLRVTSLTLELLESA